MRSDWRWAAVAALLAPAATAAADDVKVTFAVRETAGIRRFGYPVHAKLTLPRDAGDKDRFRLLIDGKAAPAQFTPSGGRTVDVDFALNCGPLEKKSLTLECGEKVEPGPEPKGGMKLTAAQGVHTVRSGGLECVVDPAYALLRSVKNGKLEYLHAGKPLAEADRPKVSAVRSGPLAVCLRAAGKGVTVEFTFPRSKSWVEVVVTLDDPDGAVESYSAELPLTLAGKPTLADFGGGSSVYTTLTGSQGAELRGDDRQKQRWAVYTGDKGKSSAFVVPPPDSDARAEGWAHVMDAERCTAAAVDRFGRGVADAMAVKADGTLTLSRRWAKGAKGAKTYRFWLHFVPMPVQVGALTSPQSMMTPLAVSRE